MVDQGAVRWSRALTGGDGGGGLVQASPVPYWVLVTHWSKGGWSWELLDWKDGHTVDAGEGAAGVQHLAPPLLVTRDDANTWRVRDTTSKRWVGAWPTEVRALARGMDGTVWIASPSPTGGGATRKGAPIAEEDPWIAAVDRSGNERWRIPAPGPSVGGAVADGTSLLVGSGEMLYAIDGASGKVKWSRPWPGGVRGILRL